MKHKHKLVQREHQEIYDVILDIHNTAVKGGIPNEEAVDVAFLLKTVASFLNDLRKEADRVRYILEKITCMRWMQSSMNEDPTKAAQPIRGELATGTPQLKTAATLPSRTRDPDNYAKLMTRMGIGGAALKRDMVRVHWPLVVDWLTELSEQGKPMPPGIDPTRTYPVYSLRLQERKESNDG